MESVVNKSSLMDQKTLKTNVASTSWTRGAEGKNAANAPLSTSAELMVMKCGNLPDLFPEQTHHKSLSEKE